MEQRAEPPSWLPDNGQSRTGAAADLRNPEADEAAVGTSDGDTEYNFSGNTSYSDSQDTTFGQAGAAVGGYSYDPGSPADTTSVVPPYPASLTEPAAGSAKTSTPSSTNSSTTGSSSHGHDQYRQDRHRPGEPVPEPGRRRGQPRGGGER